MLRRAAVSALADWWRMPPARAADPEVDFHGILGNAMTNGALFKGSLTNDGPLKLGRSHWLSLALP
eukprot:1249313-Prymnesium_polylepis.1